MVIQPIWFFWRVVQGATFEWIEDKAPRMAAALAFYTVFSLTPIVLIAIAIGDMFYEREMVLNHALEEARFLIGAAGVDAIRLLIEHAPRGQANPWIALVGLATMFFAATGAFTELKDSLDTIWEVRPKPGLGIWDMVRNRFLSFALVLVLGFLLLVSLVASAMLTAASNSVLSFVSDRVLLLHLGNAAVSMLVITLLFALIFKVLPDAEVFWQDVWLGAVVTAVMFGVGKSLFGLYLGHSAIASNYGAAGSLVIVTLWTYYTSLIILFGAEMTQVQAKLRGHEIVPTAKAVRLTEHERVQQGIPHDAVVRESVREQEQAEQEPDRA
ncbi:MAG: YihY/virulence factor BrkB family protein [Pirellulales bacterium]|nr:YihY/virulence factor BrkB family protein [Pirellulales bacterium]